MVVLPLLPVIAIILDLTLFLWNKARSYDNQRQFYKERERERLARVCCSTVTRVKWRSRLVDDSYVNWQLALSKESIPTTIIDKNKFINEKSGNVDFRTTAISEGSKEFFESIGLWKKIAHH